MTDSIQDMLSVGTVRFALVVLSFLSLESYLAKRPVATAVRAGLCALTAVWIDREVVGESNNAAAAGSVLGIAAANYIMTRRRKDAETTRSD